jgi:hypothetical protein
MTEKIANKIDDRLLAAHIADNPEFADACTAGDAEKIMYIVNSEIEKNNLHTKGSKKLLNDILRMVNGKTKISASVGTKILMFVWNARMSGTGFKVMA